MGRRRKGAANRAQLAYEDGYNDDEAIAQDRVLLKGMTDGSEDKYAGSMMLWAEFCKTRKEHNPDPHSIVWAERFIEFYTRGTQGMNTQYPTTHTIDGFWRTFRSAWARETRDPISYEVKKTVKNFIHGLLQKKLNLSTEKRESHFLTLPDGVILQNQLWQKDWHDYRHEMSRVITSGALVLFLCTSARVGEFFQTAASKEKNRGLRYKDLTFTVRRQKDGSSEIHIGIFRVHAKGFHDKPELKSISLFCADDELLLTTWYRPKHVVYEKSNILWCNPVLWILVFALADDAFLGYRTLEEILALEPPPDQNIWHVRWKESVLELPVFRQMSSQGPTDKILSATCYDRLLSMTGYRAGFEVGIGVHAARREALLKVDNNGYSISQRMRFAGHSNPNTYFKSYNGQLSTVDGQGSMFEQELRSDHFEDFRGLSLHRNPQLWQSLPAKQQFELECRQDYLDLEEKIENLTKEVQTMNLKEDVQHCQARRQELNNQRRRLYLEELKKCRKLQPRSLKSDAGLETSSEHHRQNFFRDVRALMPERDRLATSLFLPVSLRSVEGRNTVRDLIALCKQGPRVIHRPSLLPIEGRCPSPECSKELESISIHLVWRHIRQCTRKHLKHKHGFAELCLLCDEWVTNSNEWEQHCQSHLDKPETLPLWCEFKIFRQAPIYAGHCPFCLGDSRLSASLRLKHFFDRYSWQEHILKHLQDLEADKIQQCSHPRCVVSYDTNQALQHHLQDIHGANITRRLKRRLPDSTLEDDKVGVKRPRPSRLENDKAHSQKRSAKSKRADKTPLRDEGMKHTFITYIADASQKDDRPFVKAGPKNKSEKHKMAPQRSRNESPECLVSMNNPTTGFSPEVDDEERYASATPSVESECTSLTSCSTWDETTNSGTPESSMLSSKRSLTSDDEVMTPISESADTSGFLLRIDPALLALSENMQFRTQSDDVSLKSDEPIDASPRTARCPMCQDEVDAHFLALHMNGEKRMKVRAQLEFCIAHKKKSAECERMKRGYPAIRWDTLEERLSGFHSILHDIMNSRTPSFYRESLAREVSVKRRQRLCQASLHGVGYYGPRGSEILLAHAMNHFSSHIRDIATADHLVTFYGPITYAQEVLVPEMAMMLVKEDMNVDDLAARQILEESTKLGELLNDDDE